MQSDGRVVFVYALVDRGRLVLDDYVRQHEFVAFDLAARDGHYYLAKPPLPSLLLVPAYAALRLALPPADVFAWDWRWLLTLLVSGTAFALVALLMRRLARDLGFPEEQALLAALAVAFGTPLLLYAGYLFSHELAAILVLALFWCALRAPRFGFATGLLLGAIASTELFAVFPAAVLTGGHALASVRAREPRAILAVAAGALVGITPLLGYQWLAFGSPFALVYSSLAEPTYRQAVQAGLFGLPRPEVALALLASGDRGLFVFAPPVLAAVLAVPALWRRFELRRPLALGYGAAAPLLVVLSAFAFWDGGAAYGPRHIVSVIPLLAWPVAAMSPGRLRALAVASSALQLLVLGAREPLLPPGYPVAYVELAQRPVHPSLLGLLLAAAGVPQAPAFAMAALALTAAALVALARLASPTASRAAPE